jgi:hypothetical protein
MDNVQKLRELIRDLIKKELDEATTTDAAGPYLTPLSFRGNKKRGMDRMKHIATQVGMQLTPSGEKEINKPGDKLHENKYYEYKNDSTKTPHQKIAEAISQLNRNLQEIERVIKMNSRLKTESGIAGEQLWKRTQKGMLKLEAKLLGLATRIREIRGQ